MPKIDLLTRASFDLEVSIELLALPKADEKFLDIAAYHLQQCIEKVMKYTLAQHGVKFERTHDIEILCRQFIDAKIELPDWIFDNATLLTNYATQTRYGDSVLGVRRRLLGFHALAKELVDEQMALRDEAV